MNTQTLQKKKTLPQIVKLDKALNLAERWVNNMTMPANDDEPTEVECRPPRLGLGAKVSRQSTVGPSNNPIERKLQARLNAGKRKNARSTEEESTPVCNDEDDEEDDNLESRSSVFAKKRSLPVTSALLTKKKQKQLVGF